jgi:chromosomal replication initiation ATPase DnaA
MSKHAVKSFLEEGDYAKPALTIMPASHTSDSELDGTIKSLELRLAKLQRIEELANAVIETERRVTIRGKQDMKIVSGVVCAFYGITETELVARCKRENIVWPRFIFLHLSRHLTKATLQQCSYAVNRDDHGTVACAIQRVQERMEVEPTFRAEVARIETLCRAAIKKGTA